MEVTVRREDSKVDLVAENVGAKGDVKQIDL